MRTRCGVDGSRSVGERPDPTEPTSRLLGLEVFAVLRNAFFVKHNIDEQPNMPTKYGVRGIPTMLLFKDGELKATKVGATTKSNIVSWIKENI